MLAECRAAASVAWDLTTANHTLFLSVVTLVATLVLIVATVRTGRFAAKQAEATRRATEEAIWTNKEAYYARMLEEAGGPPGARRINATWALIEIAEEWGDGRRRREIVNYFRCLATEEDAVRANGGDDGILSVSAVLAEWDRHGVGVASLPSTHGLDQSTKPSLLAHLKHAYYNWRRQNSEWEPKPSIQTRDVRRSVDKATGLVRTVETKLRASGHVAFSFRGHATVRVGWKARSWVRGEDIDWDRLPQKVQGAAWSWLNSLESGGKLRLTLNVQAAFSTVAPTGEWLVSAMIVDKAKNQVPWRWRSDGPVWLTTYQEAVTEVDAASTAGLNALGCLTLGC